MSFVRVSCKLQNESCAQSQHLTAKHVFISLVDKTGTLTTNEMTAVSLVMLESENNDDGTISIKEHPISGFSYSPEGQVDGIEQSTEVKNNPSGAVHDIAAVSALCNDATIVAGNDPKTESKRAYERIGEPTEAALCVLTEKLGGYFDVSSTSAPQILASANVNKWRESHPRQATLGECFHGPL